MRTISSLLLYFASTATVRSMAGNVTCSETSRMSPRSPNCALDPSLFCESCLPCPNGQASTFRPQVPPSWHGHLNDTSLFDGSTSFRILDLSNLGIVYVQPYLFDRMPMKMAAEEVRLQFNNLTLLEDGVFSGLRLVRLINLSHNALDRIGSKVFDTPDRSACLQIVDVSHNNLAHMDAWPYYDGQECHLELFDLTHNRIDSFRNPQRLSFDVIEATEANCKDIVIDLQWNKFTSVAALNEHNGVNVFEPKHPFPSSLAYFKLTIEMNDWLCDCTVFDFMLIVKNIYPFLFPDYQPLFPRCKYPLSLRNKSLMDADLLNTLDKFVCNVTRACPPRCLCREIPARGTILIDCQAAGLRSLPATLPQSNLPLTINMADNDISFLKREDYLTRVRELILRGNRLEEVSEEAVDMLQEASHLDFSENLLSTVPSALSALPVSSVNLESNPLRCDCELEWLAIWTREHVNLTCVLGNQQVALDSMAATLGCAVSIAVPIAVTLAVMVVLVVAVVVLYRVWLRRQLPKWAFRLLPGVFPRARPPEGANEREVGFDRLHDAYLSLDDDSDDVRQWVVRDLLPGLESERPRLNVYLRARDSTAGNDIADEIYNGLKSSRHLVVVLSRDYCRTSGYSLHELDVWVGGAGPEGVMPLLLLYEDVEPERVTSQVVDRLLLQGRLFRRGDKHCLADLKYELLKR